MTEGPGRDRPREHERKSEFLLAPAERRVLPRLARALPGWVVPDHLTALGIAAATATGAAYILTNTAPGWLWAASAFLALQWFGDSLDGTLARVRHIERPRYGFYLDHLTDAYSTLAVGLGLGLSPYMLLSVALAVVVAYLVLSINVYLETYVFGEFRMSYGRIGPTEARLILITLNTIAWLFGPARFHLAGVPLTPYDIAGTLAALAMLALLLRRAALNLQTLARLEPRRPHAEEPDTPRVP